MAMITDKINFKQPKYMLPAILYPLLLITGYLVFDLFVYHISAKIYVALLVKQRTFNMV